MFWGNENTTINPKPKIKLSLNQDPNFIKTEVHFDELFYKYGGKIFVLNLVKTIRNVDRPSETSREFELGKEFSTVVKDLSKRYLQKNVKIMEVNFGLQMV